MKTRSKIIAGVSLVSGIVLGALAFRNRETIKLEIVNGAKKVKEKTADTQDAIHLIIDDLTEKECTCGDCDCETVTECQNTCGCPICCKD